MNPVEVHVSIQSNNVTYHVGFNEAIISGGSLPWYDGSYTVQPKIVSQTLNTKQMSMKDDVTVEAIPYSEVTNPQGGKTVNIAFA